jgi:hypothetical protein
MGLSIEKMTYANVMQGVTKVSTIISKDLPREKILSRTALPYGHHPCTIAIITHVNHQNTIVQKLCIPHSDIDLLIYAI